MELPKLRRKGRLDPVSENTMKAYRQSWTLFSRWLDSRQPTWEFAQEWLQEILEGRSPTTVMMYGNALRRILPAMGVPKPSEDYELLLPGRVKRVPKYLDEEELRRVIAACSTPLELCLVLVLVDTGLRISELLALTTRDVDFENRFIFAHREKVQKESWIPISEGALAAIKEYMSWRESKRMSLFPFAYRDAYQILKAVGAKAGVALHPHLLRHTAAALRRIKHDQPIQDLQELLGHTSISTTQIYSAISPRDLQEKIKPVF